jgi:hypothetical protein
VNVPSEVLQVYIHDFQITYGKQMEQSKYILIPGRHPNTLIMQFNKILMSKS